MSENKKCLQANAAMIDATKVTEENLQAYGSIKLKCAILVTTARTQQILSRYGANIDSAMNLEVPQDCALSMLNGNFSLGEIHSPDSLTLLVVNGNLRVNAADKAKLEMYHKIIVNGTVLSPEDLSVMSDKLLVNGVWTTYPAGAVLLDRSVGMDKAFIIQARPETYYYVTGRVLMAADGLDLSPLLEKKVRIKTQNALVREDLLDAAAAILDDQAVIRTIPAGYQYMDGGDAFGTLQDAAGKSLFIDGDLDLQEGHRGVLAAIRRLEVTGTVRLPESLKALFFEKCAKSGGITVPNEDPAACLSDWRELDVTSALLEEYPDGLRIEGCGSVVIAEDVDPAMLRERIRSISDCITVQCTPAQKAVLYARCSDVLLIESKKDGEDADTTFVNSALYTM